MKDSELSHLKLANQRLRIKIAELQRELGEIKKRKTRADVYLYPKLEVKEQ